MIRWGPLLVLVVTGGVLFGCSGVSEQGMQSAELMKAANQLYDTGHYAEALHSYAELVDRGVQSSALYYNLGNAYYRVGDLGRAVLNYKRAARLDPNDADIEASLNFVRGRTIDRLGPGDEGSLARFGREIRTTITANGVATATLALWTGLVALGVLAWRLRPGQRRRAAGYTLLVVAILFAFGLFALVTSSYGNGRSSAAVVIADEVTLLSGPGDQYTTQLVVHSGAEVSVVETRAQWARLALPGGDTQGWAHDEAVEHVAPVG